MKLSPLVKGIITAVVMIGFSLVAYYFIPEKSSLHYLVYGIYAAGVCWTLIAYRKSPSFSGRFSDNFNTGFSKYLIYFFLLQEMSNSF